MIGPTYFPYRSESCFSTRELGQFVLLSFHHTDQTYPDQRFRSSSEYLKPVIAFQSILVREYVLRYVDRLDDFPFELMRDEGNYTRERNLFEQLGIDSIGLEPR